MSFKEYCIFIALVFICATTKFVLELDIYHFSFIQNDVAYNPLDFNAKIRMIIMSLVLLVMPNFSFWRHSIYSKMTKPSYILITAGVFSNMSEGVLYSAVFDYFPHELSNGDIIIFNVADIFIFLGWFTLIPTFMINAVLRIRKKIQQKNHP